jgi:hypothetical protein
MRGDQGGRFTTFSARTVDKGQAEPIPGRTQQTLRVQRSNFRCVHRQEFASRPTVANASMVSIL